MEKTTLSQLEPGDRFLMSEEETAVQIYTGQNGNKKHTFILESGLFDCPAETNKNLEIIKL